MNSKLKDLYSNIHTLLHEAVSKWNDDDSHEIKIADPWLLYASSDYINASKKIMLIGQEAWRWGDVYSVNKSVDELMEMYAGFISEQTIPGKKLSSPIWNLYRLIIKWGESNNVFAISNNIGKLCYVTKNNKGEWNGGVNGFNEPVNKLMIDIFRKEIEICRPDLIFFVCGTYYEQKYIKDLLGSYSVKKVGDIETRRLAELVFENPPVPLPKVYRTYHPRYLQMNRQRTEWGKQVYSFIENTVQEL